MTQSTYNSVENPITPSSPAISNSPHNIPSTTSNQIKKKKNTPKTQPPTSMPFVYSGPALPFSLLDPEHNRCEKLYRDSEIKLEDVLQIDAAIAIERLYYIHTKQALYVRKTGFLRKLALRRLCSEGELSR
jgi:hypothetical protein